MKKIKLLAEWPVNPPQEYCRNGMNTEATRDHAKRNYADRNFILKRKEEEEEEEEEANAGREEQQHDFDKEKNEASR